MKKKNIIITGVAGFIGSSFANILNNKSYTIYGIDDLSTGCKESISKNVIFFKHDLSKGIPKKLESKSVKIDYIFHFAGQSSGEKSFEDPISDLQRNTVTTLNLIKFSIKKKIKRFFYMSSMSVYGDANYASEKSKFNPKTCYGVSKITSELYLKIYEKELSYTIFRLFNVYGPSQRLDNLKQGMIRIYISQLIKTNKIIVKGSLERSRDFIYIDDLVEIFLKLMNYKKSPGLIVNIGTGKKTTVKKIISILQNLRKDVKITIAPSTKGDQQNIYANINKLKKITSIKKFTSIEDGIKIFYKKAIN